MRTAAEARLAACTTEVDKWCLAQAEDLKVQDQVRLAVDYCVCRPGASDVILPYKPRWRWPPPTTSALAPVLSRYTVGWPNPNQHQYLSAEQECMPRTGLCAMSEGRKATNGTVAFQPRTYEIGPNVAGQIIYHACTKILNAGDVGVPLFARTYVRAFGESRGSGTTTRSKGRRDASG